MSVGYGSFYIDNNGDLWAMGYSPYGHLGYVGTKYSPVKVNVPGKVKQAVIGDYCSLILLTDGKVYSMGSNVYSQAGLPGGSVSSHNTNATPTFVMSDVKKIAAGYNFSYILKNNGELYGCGTSYYGQLKHPTTGNHTVNYMVLIDTNVIDMDCGYLTGYWVKTDGSVWGVGYGRNYALGNGLTNVYNKNPIRIMSSGDVNKVFAGGIAYCFVLKQNGELWAWGSNGYGQLGFNDTTNRTTPVYTGRKNIAHVSTGYYHTFFIDTSGNLYGAGYNRYGQLGTDVNINTNNPTYYRFIKSGVKRVGCGYYHSLIVDNDGSLRTTGYTYYGQIGDGRTSSVSYNGINNVLVTNVSMVFNTFIGSNITLTNLSIGTPIHKQTTTLNAVATHSDGYKIKWAVYVNGTKVYPTDADWTGLQPSPLSITKYLDASLFNVGNNKVTLSTADEYGTVRTADLNVVVTNTNPVITFNPPAAIHKGNLTVQATVNDLEGDKLQYSITVNGTKFYPSSGMSDFFDPPLNITAVVPNSLLRSGNNTIKIDVKDDMGGTASITKTVALVNGSPTVVTASMTGISLHAVLDDPDRDKVRYHIVLNGEQVFPSVGYTDYYTTPLTIDFMCPRNKVKIGQNNILAIYMQDDMGAANSYVLNFVGEYAGLLFCDETESYYSDDIGDILKYLDFGTIIAGSSTSSAKVYLKNTLPFSVQNIRIWSDNGDLDGENAYVELSKSDAPFFAEDVLVFPQTLAYGEKIPFYVRVVTKKGHPQGGMFDIYAKADPV